VGITVDVTGSFANTQRFLQRMSKQDVFNILDRYGPAGVSALAAATPSSTGETANSWTYEIKQTKGGHEIVWKNSHIVNGANIALLIQHGHGTGTGGYVPGRDYINPALKPIFEQILADIRRVVKA
jgi:hypothetical protein